VKVTGTRLPGVLVVEPKVFGDARGFFLESYRADRYAEAGVAERFLQDNMSRSRRGVLRGLHFQHPFAQGKLVQVLEGEVFDVAVDVRVGSPTFGQWWGDFVSAGDKRQVYIPAGFAHGFVVTSEAALFAYKCTEYYHPEAERSVLWNDPAIGIEWPIADVELSAKDAVAPTLASLSPDALPRYAP
jgi:dTDP-4-dehydrorhamnose 3,5-epimerase